MGLLHYFIIGINEPIVVLYDKPPSIFKKLTKYERNQFLARLDWSQEELIVADQTLTQSPFTRLTNDGKLSEDSNRPALICSSTSWTEDEDFDILISALKIYDSTTSSRRLYVVITGKGPLKQFYMDRIRTIKFQKVIIKSCWVEQQDYPTLIGSCDLGISLHTSSSGLDLPMKIADLFGCSVPVCAVDFPW